MIQQSDNNVIDQLAAFQSSFPKKRPFITLSFAQSLDGCISANIGERLTISGQESLVLTHQLRAIHQGLLVGISTVLVDNPLLTVRYASGNNPKPIVLDSSLRFPADARMLASKSHKPIIATGTRIDETKAKNLRSQGLKIVPLKLSQQSLVPIPDLLDHLFQQGITSIMVEGGSKVISSFLALGLCDYMVVTVSPMIIGNPKSVRYGLRASDKVPYLGSLKSLKMGNDLVLWGQPKWKTLEQDHVQGYPQ